MMFSNRDAMRLKSREKKQDALRLESLPIQKPHISSGESPFINLRPELTWTHYRLLLRMMGTGNLFHQYGFQDENQCQE